MNSIKENLEIQKHEIEAVITYAENILRRSPEGTLRTSTSNGNKLQYYIKDGYTGAQGRYLGKKEEKLIHELAQKEYAQKLLSEARKKQKTLNRFSKAYFQQDFMDIYNNLAKARKKAVIPYELPDNEYAEFWQQEAYVTFISPRAPELDIINGIFTEKGELVRSKSEKIIADKLFMMNIPYHYEKPLMLAGYGYVHPDFTVLNRKTRKEYYWEHFGMMDDAGYVEKAVQKIETYERNLFFTGEQLLLTYETRLHPLNTGIMDNLIRKYLL